MADRRLYKTVIVASFFLHTNRAFLSFRELNDIIVSDFFFSLPYAEAVGARA